MLPRVPALRVGDVVYSLGNWRTQGIVPVKLTLVEGNIAKVCGQFLQLDKEFFRTRGEALQEMIKRVYAARRVLDQNHRKKHGELDRLLEIEHHRAKAESTAG